MKTISLSRKKQVTVEIDGEEMSMEVRYTPVSAKNIIAIRSRMAEAGDDETEQAQIAIEFISQLVHSTDVTFEVDGEESVYPSDYEGRYVYWSEVCPFALSMEVFAALNGGGQSDEGK